MLPCWLLISQCLLSADHRAYAVIKEGGRACLVSRQTEIKGPYTARKEVHAAGQKPTRRAFGKMELKRVRQRGEAVHRSLGGYLAGTWIHTDNAQDRPGYRLQATDTRDYIQHMRRPIIILQPRDAPCNAIDGWQVFQTARYSLLPSY